jgi:hypothetical protein
MGRTREGSVDSRCERPMKSKAEPLACRWTSLVRCLTQRSFEKIVATKIPPRPRNDHPLNAPGNRMRLEIVRNTLLGLH